MRLVPSALVGSKDSRGFAAGDVVQNHLGQEVCWDGDTWHLNPKLRGETGSARAINESVKGKKDLTPREQEEAALGMRFNTNKVRFDLIPASWLRVLAQILTKGAVKYAPRNWEKGLSWSETLGSLHRHLDAWMSGETYDKETKCHHMGHVAWNALALMTMQLRGIGKSDITDDTDKTMED